MSQGFEIQNHMLFRCTGNDTTVRIPDSVEIIMNYAFSSCRSVTEIHIPAGVREMEVRAFDGCMSLTRFTVDPANETYDAQDGILVNKSRDTILWVPPGQQLTEYTIPENITGIGDHAFGCCMTLEKIVIPSTVRKVGDRVFPRGTHNEPFSFREIEVEGFVGLRTIGSEVFNLDRSGTKPLVYPQLPIDFVREEGTQIDLALGYCMDPSRYKGTCAASYEFYLMKHKAKMLEHSIRLGFPEVAAFYADRSRQGHYSYEPPQLSVKVSKRSKFRLREEVAQKRRLLEETVQKGGLLDVMTVLDAYRPVHVTERALGFAARFRGVEFVELLDAYGATFRYEHITKLQSSYRAFQMTRNRSYQNEFPNMQPVNVEERKKCIRFFRKHQTLGLPPAELLFLALIDGDLQVADMLMELGVDLSSNHPNGDEDGSVGNPMYLRVITEAIPSLEWSAYVERLCSLPEDQVLPVMERLYQLADKEGRKPAIPQEMAELILWKTDAFTFIMNKCNTSTWNQLKLLEHAVTVSAIGALEVMADVGWLSDRERRETIIEFAQENACYDALAWLLEFKQRTVDVEAEEAEELERMFQELMGSPDEDNLFGDFE